MNNGSGEHGTLSPTRKCTGSGWTVHVLVSELIRSRVRVRVRFFFYLFFSKNRPGRWPLIIVIPSAMWVIIKFHDAEIFRKSRIKKWNARVKRLIFLLNPIHTFFSVVTILDYCPRVLHRLSLWLISFVLYLLTRSFVTVETSTVV